MNSEVRSSGINDEPSQRVYIRGRPVKIASIGRSRSRYESADDHVPIDFSKPLIENIHICLENSICYPHDEQGSYKQIRLNHLNNLVRLMEKYRIQMETRPSKKFSDSSSSNVDKSTLTFEHIIICLRCLLTDEEREIRAATLRVLRYSITSEYAFEIVLRYHLDILIVRCLDTMLDNRIERNQCIRLLVSLIQHCPCLIPTTFVRALLAICLDGHDENDRLSRVSTAVLCELLVRNCDMVLACGGVTWLIRSILFNGQSSPRLAECMTVVLSNIYNNPTNRIRYESVLKNIFYDLFAPLMDENFKLSGADKDEKTIQLRPEGEQILDNCRAALVACLRTWPGLVACFSNSTLDNGSDHRHGVILRSPIYSLVVALALESEKINDFALDALCEIFNLPYRDETYENWEKMLDTADSVLLDEYKYTVNQQFVNADAKNVLMSWNRSCRTNLTDQTNLLILLGLVDAGIIDALIRVIIPNPNRPLALKMTMVLSDVLYMSGRLPSCYRQLALTTPLVLEYIYDDDYDGVEHEPRCFPVAPRKLVLPRKASMEVKRLNAAVLAHRLRALSTVRQHGKRVRTLQMERLLAKYRSNFPTMHCQTLPSENESPNITLTSTGTMEKVSRTQTLRTPQATVARSASLPTETRFLAPKPAMDRVHDLIRDSRATTPYSNYTTWDWSLIYLALNQILEHPHHLDDSTCSKFTAQLTQFFHPVNGQFHKMGDDYRQCSRAGCALMQVLGHAPVDGVIAAQLRGFLGSIVQNLLPDRLYVGQLSVKNIAHGACADYFLFIGQLSSTAYGRVAWEKTGVAQRLIDMVNQNTHEAYIKLIISSMLDYDRVGLGRLLLQKALTGGKVEARMYATTFLSTLGKLGIADFDEWGMEMLINQLRDNSRAVVEEAARVLEELVYEPVYRKAMLRLRPSLLPLGDAGVLLLTHYMSCEVTINSMIKLGDHAKQPTNHFVAKEIERWKNTFNLKYARIVDERLSEGFTSYRRLADGSFPRHVSSDRRSATDVFLPPHLFGQLANHPTGCQLLLSHDCFSHLLEVLQNGTLNSETEIMEMKAAMWALAHVASHDIGLALLQPTILVCFAKLAEECPVLSVRGCAFFALNLAARSGAVLQLQQLGWETTAFGTFWSRKTQAKPDAESYTNGQCGTCDVSEVDAALLSNSLTSGVSLTSSSPPQPSIVVSASPASMRKCSLSSRTSTFRCRSHRPSVDGWSVRTCASCELCRQSPLLWSGNRTSPSSISPIRITCCDERQSVSQDSQIERGITSAPATSTASTSSRSALALENFLSAANAVANVLTPNLFRKSVQERTPKTSNSTIAEQACDNQTITSDKPPELTALDDSSLGLDATAVDMDESLINGHSEWLAKQFRLIDDEIGFFKRTKKFVDESADVRRHFGLTKVPVVPVDLPTSDAFRGQHAGGRTLSDENAAGMIVRRMLGRQGGSSFEGVSSETGSKMVNELASFDDWQIDEEDSPEIDDNLTINSNISQSVAADDEAPVCLPVDIGLVCNVVDWPSTTGQSTSSVLADDNQLGILSSDGFYFDHLIDQCLRCSSTDYSDRRRSSAVGIFDNLNSPKNDSKNSTAQYTAFRKELMRLVSLINVRKKYAEQGLLRLKQEAPSMFRSLCLYCDISYLLSVYAFRLSARRFLHEIFQDVDFGDLWTEPRRFLLRESPSS